MRRQTTQGTVCNAYSPTAQLARFRISPIQDLESHHRRQEAAVRHSAKTLYRQKDGIHGIRQMLTLELTELCKHDMAGRASRHVEILDVKSCSRWKKKWMSAAGLFDSSRLTPDTLPLRRNACDPCIDYCQALSSPGEVGGGKGTERTPCLFCGDL